MRVFKTKSFGRWARKVELPDSTLMKAVLEMERGLIDADLGGGLYKKRVPLPGQGKRGSARTLIATNRQGTWIFLAGYLKSEQESLRTAELLTYRMLAGSFLTREAGELDIHVASNLLEEIS